MTELTESQVVRKAIKASRNDFKDQVVVVYHVKEDYYSFVLESNYTGEETNVVGKYLNGLPVEE